MITSLFPILTHLFKEAESIEDAISRYYDVENEATAPRLPTTDAEAETGNRPPPYARSAISGVAHQYSNIFSEAADIRSQDEVQCGILPS